MTDDKPFSRVVVPVDGSSLAASAIPHAAALARKAGMPLTVFGLTDSQHECDNVRRDLEPVIAPLRDDLPVDVVIDAVGAVLRLNGYIAESILDEANSDDALICIASHGRSGLGAALLGSVTEQVLRGSSRPVLVVGPNCTRAPRESGGRVVACLDGSPFAEQAVPAAATWAEGLGLPLWLVQVIDPTAGPPPDLVRSSDFRESSYLHSVAQHHPHAEFDVLHSHHPARELADLTRSWPVSVLVMATHGRSGWSRVALGSVAMSVVHDATCPVLLVRPPGIESDKEDTAS